jgi:hypothetical protein
MKKGLVAYLLTAGMFALAFFLYFIPTIPSAYAVVTITVIGYATPNASTLGYGLIPFILPIAVAGLFIGLARGIDIQGETSSLILKIGLFTGCLLGMLSLTSSSPTLIPVALPVVSGTYVITYLWKKV